MCYIWGNKLGTDCEKGCFLFTMSIAVKLAVCFPTNLKIARITSYLSLKSLGIHENSAVKRTSLPV